MAESTLYLFGILALLGLWLFHQRQVRSGRIQAIDLFDRSVTSTSSLMIGRLALSLSRRTDGSSCPQ